MDDTLFEDNGNDLSLSESAHVSLNACLFTHLLIDLTVVLDQYWRAWKRSKRALPLPHRKLSFLLFQTHYQHFFRLGHVLIISPASKSTLLPPLAGKFPVPAVFSWLREHPLQSVFIPR